VKEGFLKVGDIVFLKFQVKGVPKSNVFLSSDGVLSKTVECIPNKASNGRVKGADELGFARWFHWPDRTCP